MNRDNRNAIIIGLLIAVAFMSVGYALLSTKIENDNLTTSMSSSKNGELQLFLVLKLLVVQLI